MRAPLQGLIGKRFRYRGELWTVVEVLHTEDALVIAPQDSHPAPPIQADQYGNAKRRCAHCLTLPLSDPEDPDRYSPEVMELLAGGPV